MMEPRTTSLYRVLQLVRDSGHTSLTIDDVAVDHELREAYGVGLNDPIKIFPVDQVPPRHSDQTVGGRTSGVGDGDY